MASSFAFFFFRIVFAIYSPLLFHVKFGSSCQVPQKTFSAFWLECIHGLIWGKLTTFTILSYLNHELGINNSLKFSFRSFNNVSFLYRGLVWCNFRFVSLRLYQGSTRETEPIKGDIYQKTYYKLHDCYMIWRMIDKARLNHRTGYQKG